MENSLNFKKTSKILINPTTKMPENEKKFHCATCNFVCSNKYNYNIHTSTSKHKTLMNPNEKNVKKSIECSNCGKIYKHSSTLCAHKKTCIKIINEPQINNIELKIIDSDKNESDNEVVIDSSNNDIIQVLLKENSDFKSIIIEMMKSNTDMIKNTTDLQKQMLEVYKNIQQ